MNLFRLVFVIALIAVFPGHVPAGPRDGAVAKALFEEPDQGENLLKADAWRPYGKGFTASGDVFTCDNGSDGKAIRGVMQTVSLNQTVPEPIVASVWSKAEGVGGGPNSDYSIYLDLAYQDGTPLWGQHKPFPTGTHDWKRGQVLVLPEKPVATAHVYLLFRHHKGKASFRAPELRRLRPTAGMCYFDGRPVVDQAGSVEGFQVRDVAAGSGFVHLKRAALGLKLDVKESGEGDARFFDVTLSDTTGKDRAVTLLYAIPQKPEGLRWLADPRRSEPVRGKHEYAWTISYDQVGATGRLSRFPFAAVANDERGVALGIDIHRPAFYRCAYNAGTGELFLAYDLALTPERPSARLRFCRFAFAPQEGFRAALACYYALFPEAFRCRVSKQGLWMPFAKISEVKGWEDFGFQFKEGDNETGWDDAHGITTFRYSEPMTWWMALPKESPRTFEAALAQARRRAEQGKPSARALFTSGMRDKEGRFVARILDTPWCDGAVWSMNSMPGIQGDVTDFKNTWNPALRDRLYGPDTGHGLDGEYIDSSEGYVTSPLDFCRAHFAAASTPLCFSADDHLPGIFRGMVVFEHVRAIAEEIHARDRLMMANGTPWGFCWLAPMLDVMGTETNWNPGGRWAPMSDRELLYRRALCKGKPYCFLMNTNFDEFDPPLVEKYMKRALAYGMFPGFFSHNASEGHYFSRPELYDRDRPLFKKYVPLCRRVAEAGWEPLPRARSSDEKVHVERFGDRYLTVFNDSTEPRTATIRLDDRRTGPTRELVSGKTLSWENGQTTLRLEGEDVAVIEL